MMSFPNPVDSPVSNGNMTASEAEQGLRSIQTTEAADVQRWYRMPPSDVLEEIRTMPDDQLSVMTKASIDVFSGKMRTGYGGNKPHNPLRNGKPAEAPSPLTIANLSYLFRKAFAERVQLHARTLSPEQRAATLAALRTEAAVKKWTANIALAVHQQMQKEKRNGDVGLTAPPVIPTQSSQGV